VGRPQYCATAISRGFGAVYLDAKNDQSWPTRQQGL
jgi:hypothetical protein